MLQHPSGFWGNHPDCVIKDWYQGWSVQLSSASKTLGLIPDASKGNNRKCTSLTNIAARALSLGIRVGGKKMQFTDWECTVLSSEFWWTPCEHSLILKFGLYVSTDIFCKSCRVFASPGLDYCSTARINLSSVIIDAAWSQREGQKTHFVNVASFRWSWGLNSWWGRPITTDLYF